MIPQRVELKGFLCYKEEQEIGFDGNATLWMLSGLNGSGKSAIFDAVTYCAVRPSSRRRYARRRADQQGLRHDWLSSSTSCSTARLTAPNARSSATPGAEHAARSRLFRFEAAATAQVPGCRWRGPAKNASSMTGWIRTSV